MSEHDMRRQEQRIIDILYANVDENTKFNRS